MFASNFLNSSQATGRKAIQETPAGTKIGRAIVFKTMFRLCRSVSYDTGQKCWYPSQTV